MADAGRLERLAIELLPEAIIHLAALVSGPQTIANPPLNFRLNVQATQCVIDAGRAVSSQRRSTDLPFDRDSAHPIDRPSDRAINRPPPGGPTPGQAISPQLFGPSSAPDFQANSSPSR